MYQTYSIVPVNYNTYDCVYLKPRKTISSPFYYPLAVTGGYVKKNSGGCCTSNDKYTYYPAATYGYNYVPSTYYYPYTTTTCYHCAPEYKYKESYYKVKGKNYNKNIKYDYVDRDKYICNECATKTPYYTKGKAIYIPPTIIVP